MRRNILLCVIVTLFFCGCKKDNDNTTPVPVKPALKLSIEFKIGNDPLTFDSIRYYNLAGNNYSVRKLKFYLSQISLIKEDSTVIRIKDYLYIDSQTPQSLGILISSLSEGCYKGISFNIGLDSALNVENGLPATADNLAMEWPLVMGGGYHFMMLEGYFRDSTSTPGYAMHLGTNSCRIPVVLLNNFCLSTNSTVTKILTMDINEWYMNPAVFDFNIDGNYIMGNMAAMQKLSGNGVDVFTIQ